MYKNVVFYCLNSAFFAGGTVTQDASMQTTSGSFDTKSSEVGGGGDFR